MNSIEHLRETNAKVTALCRTICPSVEERTQREQAELRAHLRALREIERPRPRPLIVNIIILPNSGPSEN